MAKKVCQKVSKRGISLYQCFYPSILSKSVSPVLGRFSHKVAISVVLWFCDIGCSFFLGLSLALMSHDQFLGLSLVLPCSSPTPHFLSPAQKRMAKKCQKVSKRGISLYQCYYVHTSSKSVSPVSRIFKF